MDAEDRALVVRWACAVAAVALPMAVVSALGSYALRESFDAERLVRAMGVHYRGGPSVLLLLGWGVGGWIAGTVANRHLGVVGLPGVAFVTVGAVVGVLVDLTLYTFLAGSVPELVCAVKIVCGMVWIVPGVVRVYLD